MRRAPSPLARAASIRSTDRWSARTPSSSTSAAPAATDSLRALVLRIDSPGGSAGASDAIWRELMIAKTERADRPLVVSMSDLAASGGYYIAMPAQTIVAEPSTLTGSIGIFGGKYVTGGLYGKLGAAIDSTSNGRHAEIDSPARPFTAEETKKLQEQLQAFYDQFIEKVADLTQEDTGADRSNRAGARLDRPAGARQRSRGCAGRTRPRRGACQRARQDCAGLRGGAGGLPASAELLRAAQRPVVRRRRWRGGRRCPVGDVPPHGQ